MKPLGSESARALEVVVCLEDSILDVIHLRGPGQVRAGHDASCQVVLPAEALGGQGSMVLASKDATGQAYAARALDASGALSPLGTADNVSLESGKLRVFVRTVPDTERAARGGWGLDARSLQVAAASLAGHLVFVWLLLAIPPEARALSSSDMYNNARLVKLQAKPLEDAKLVPPPPGAKGPSGANADQPSAAHSGDPGKMGKPDTKTKGMTAFKGDKSFDRPGNVSARDWVSSKGVLGVMQATDMSPILGADEQFGSKEKWAYGSDVGEPGDGAGTFGSGFDGKGKGGCPPGAVACSDKTIGIRGFSTGVDPYQGGGPAGNLHPRGKKDYLPPTIGEIKVMDGGLDREIVKRYIRKQIDAISYCYEKQLVANAELGGTITVEFVISAGGSVISARGEGTAGAKAVDTCVLEQVRGIQFPRSEGMTNVRYPFTFRTSGS
jgi:TonB family protein